MSAELVCGSQFLEGLRHLRLQDNQIWIHDAENWFVIYRPMVMSQQISDRPRILDRGKELCMLAATWRFTDSRSRIDRGMEILLWDLCQKIIEVEASRDRRLHNKLAIFGTQAHFSNCAEANLLSKASRDPHPEAVAPFLNPASAQKLSDYT